MPYKSGVTAIFIIAIDIDECLEGTFKCQDDSMQCRNTYGSYKCGCDEGLYLIDNRCQGKNSAGEILQGEFIFLVHDSREVHFTR